MPGSLPVRRQPPKPLTVVLTGLAAVALGVVIFLLVLAATGRRSGEQAQQAVFRVGSATRLAASVDRGGPLLFQDLLKGSRDIYVQHLGGDDWRAFDAHAPGAPRHCVLVWQPDRRGFGDPCSDRTFPADGSGLMQYATRVTEKGVLVVDLGAPPQPAPPPTG